MKPETLAIHEPALRRDGAVAPPIHMTTTFEHGALGTDLPHGFLYGRHGNPNVSDLETRLAALEGGGDAIAFTSGMGAASAMLTALKPGARAVFHHDLYFDVKTLARTELAKKNVAVEFVDMRDMTAVQNTLSKPAALVWFETPSNPQIDVIDIAAVAQAAHRAGAITAVDGTFATPALQRPLALGADVVMHSATKFMGGHSDVQGGVLVTKNKGLADELRTIRKITGGILSPFSAWLIARGLQTLHCRMDRHCENAQRLAEFLEAHPAVEKVRYPGLKSNPGYEIAARQMSRPGGIVSVEIKGGQAGALAAASGLRIFVNATSLGGVESLVEHRASLEGPDTTTPESLLRLSVGLEHIDDLIADFKKALAAI
ncbi:MAG: aminotransferase class I/II-fold pyridoxal phosphate-dependent enzyme [Pseudomonadota bacterium]